MKRRDFVQAIGLWLLANDLLAETCSKQTERDPVIQSPYFGAPLFALFPFEIQSLSHIFQKTIKQLRLMKPADWEKLKIFFERFRAHAERESNGDTESLTLPATEAIIARFLSDPGTADEANAALDIFYDVVSRSDGFGEALWERPYSTPGNMCAYWYDYDKPVT